MEFEHRHKLILWPRIHGKTTIGAIAYSIWRVLRNPNYRVLFVSGAEEYSDRLLKSVRDHFMRNERLRYYFPEFCLPSGKDMGSREGFNVACRTSFDKELNFQSISIESSHAGPHYDLIIWDDVVTDKNSETLGQCQKIIDLKRGKNFLLDPQTGQEVVIGTRYHYFDLYGDIIDNQSKIWKITLKKIWTKETEHLPWDERIAIWPEKWSREYIDEIFGIVGSASWAAQMEQNPLDPESIIFDQKRIKYIRKDALPVINKFIFCDPAVSLSKTADYTAAVVVGIDAEDNHYLLDILHEKEKPLQLFQDLIELKKAYDPIMIGIEANSWQEVLKDYYDYWLAQNGINLKVDPIPRKTKETKHKRILGIQPILESERFYIVTSCRHQGEFISELSRYTESGSKHTHDDILDALSDVVRYGFSPSHGGRKTQVLAPHSDAFYRAWEKSVYKSANNKLVI